MWPLEPGTRRQSYQPQPAASLLPTIAAMIGITTKPSADFIDTP